MSSSRLYWLFAVAAACGVGAVLWLGTARDTAQLREPDPSTAHQLTESERDALAVVAAQVAEESRAGPRVVRVEGAPRGVPMSDPGAQRVESRVSPPEGYTFVEHHGEVPTQPFRPRRDVGAGSNDDGLDWFGSSSSLSRLTAHAAAAGRDWSFGWVRMARDSRLADVAPALSPLGVVVEGSTGPLVRARLPGDPSGLAAVAALSGVEAVGAAPLVAKLAPALAERVIAEPADGVATVFATLMADDPNGLWRRELERLGAVVGAYDDMTRTYVANVAYGLVNAVAAADFVMFVEPVAAVAAALDTAVPAMGADSLRAAQDLPGSFTGTGGASVPVGILDTGLNVAHLDLASNRESICGASFVPGTRSLFLDPNGHGTHVTGIFVGNGTAEAKYAGMAPLVRDIRVAKVLDDANRGNALYVFDGMDFLSEATECSAGGWSADPARPSIINASLATFSELAGRDILSRKLDAVAWAHRQLYVVAMGNAADHAHSALAAAKNALAVGAVRDSGELWSNSSVGPTADGRLAPSVVGTGVAVYSTKGDGESMGYAYKNGTSMAAPSVAGVAALLMDAAPSHREHPSLARARLMASAIRPSSWLEDPAAFPADNSSGPGALNARFGLGKVSARTSVLGSDRPDGWTSGSFSAALEDGEYAYHDIEVPEGADRLDVVLTWDEPPTDALYGAVLNDLDLWLDHGADCAEVECGERWSASRKDNVEWVFVRNPTPGTWRAKVAASRVYTAAPRAALAWTVIRGPATPELAVTAERSPADSDGVTVSVTVDGYVAAGTWLHVECRAPREDQDDGAAETTHCGSRAVYYPYEVTNADGLSTRAEVTWGDSVPLGEIAAGESREVRFTKMSGTGGRTFHFTATAWNAYGASASVAEDDEATAIEPPENDRFAAATLLEGESGNRRIDLLHATTEPGEPDYATGSGRPAASVWYRLKASAAVPVHIGVVRDGAFRDLDDFALRVDVFEGSSVAGTRTVVSAPWTASFFAVPDQEYAVRISSAARAGRAIMRWRLGARPANDDLDSAADIGGEADSVAGSNLGATLEPGEFFGEHGATVWYNWVAPADGRWRFRVSPARLDVLAFSGEAVGDLRLVSGHPSWQAVFPARAGDSYRIAVASADAFSSGGQFDLSWSASDQPPAARDDVAQADPLDGEAGSWSVSIGAKHSVEPGEHLGSGVRTAWWSWTAPTTRAYTWRLAQRAQGQTLGAFAGDSPGTLTQLGAVGANGGFSFSAEEGQAYLLAVGASTRAHNAFHEPTLAGTAEWGPTPENDVWSTTTPVLTGASGSVSGSNLYATTEAHERVHDVGHSSLWWTFEAPGDGWYRFWVDETSSPFTVAAFVHAPESAGRLEMIIAGVSTSGTGPEIVFEAKAGELFAIRLGTSDLAKGGDFTLRWDETEPLQQLKYLGQFLPSGGEAGAIRNPRALVFEPAGRVLYVASPHRLSVLYRDPDTGMLTDGQSLPTNMNSASLIWHRNRLLAFGIDEDGYCRTNSYSPTDGTYRRLRGLGALRFAPGNTTVCGSTGLFEDPTGESLFAIAGNDIQVFRFDADSDAYDFVQEFEFSGIVYGWTQSNDGSHLYVATTGGSLNTLHTLEHDPATGELTELDATTPEEQSLGLAVSDDGRYLWSIRQRATVYGLDDPSAPVLLGSLNSTPRFSLNAYCYVVLSRNEQPAADVFCGNSAFVARWNTLTGAPELASFVSQNRRSSTDLPLLPAYGVPRFGAASPDGRHAYVNSQNDGIIIFERIGNRIVDVGTTDDDYVRLSVLSISDEGRVTFGPLSSGRCITVEDLEYQGVNYTVANSNWQTRQDSEGTWTAIEGTATELEVCAYEPDEPGEYRLVAAIDIDGERGMYASNIIIHADE